MGVVSEGYRERTFTVKVPQKPVSVSSEIEFISVLVDSCQHIGRIWKLNLSIVARGKRARDNIQESKAA